MEKLTLQQEIEQGYESWLYWLKTYNMKYQNQHNIINVYCNLHFASIMYSCGPVYTIQIHKLKQFLTHCNYRIICD